MDFSVLLVFGGLVCASHVSGKQWDWHLVSLLELSGDEDVQMEMGNLRLSLGWVQPKGLGFSSSTVEKILCLDSSF